MMIVLLVLFVLDGEPHNFAVQTAGPEECIALQAKVREILPKLIGKPPQFYAASCAEVKPFTTDL